MTNQNIFSALAKYNSATDENYLTESFIFVLNSLLKMDRSLGLEILTKLCVRENEFSFDEDELITISTQVTTEQGRPDIKISTPSKLIYVEVKHDSGLKPDQVARYKIALDSSPATTKHVILLTRFAVDLDELYEQPYKHVRWREIYNWLGKATSDNPVVQFILDSFKSFLEEKQMSIQKVSWEYANGVLALNCLINMIEIGIQAAKLRIHQKSGGWDFKGYYMEGGAFWCGIWYDDPLIITFDIQRKYKVNYNLSALEESCYPSEEDRECIRFKLHLDEQHFFCLSKDEQVDVITKFIKDCHADTQRMKVK